MKVHNYNVQKYPFKILLEDLLECKLEKIHEKYKISSEEIVGKVYEYFRTNNDFQLLWKSFCDNVLKEILEDTKIVVQQLPSVKIIPSKEKLTESGKNKEWVQFGGKIIEQDGMKFNCHSDGEAPFFHPSWETNFWIPMVDVDEDNTMYVMNDNKLKPCLLKHGQILEANLNSYQHGAKTFNNSKNSRVSLDCRGLAHREYDTDKLSDTIIKSKNINFKQSEYFSVGQYYMEV
jgi:hypothetical protein|tara:strand:- start:9104 stop:9802 length:699 start_codon:yes stop_codon:yes gene_type:complete